MTLLKAGALIDNAPVKLNKPKGDTVRRALLSEIDHLGTPTIIWFLVKRHKVGLLSTWAVVMTTLYLFPFVPALIVNAILAI